MKIVESYMPVFQKWGDNDLCIYNDPHDPSRDEDSIFMVSIALSIITFYTMAIKCHTHYIRFIQIEMG